MGFGDLPGSSGRDAPTGPRRVGGQRSTSTDTPPAHTRQHQRHQSLRHAHRGSSRQQWSRGADRTSQDRRPTQHQHRHTTSTHPPTPASSSTPACSLSPYGQHSACSATTSLGAAGIQALAFQLLRPTYDSGPTNSGSVPETNQFSQVGGSAADGRSRSMPQLSRRIGTRARHGRAVTIYRSPSSSRCTAEQDCGTWSPACSRKGQSTPEATVLQSALCSRPTSFAFSTSCTISTALVPDWFSWLAVLKRCTC